MKLTSLSLLAVSLALPACFVVLERSAAQATLSAPIAPQVADQIPAVSVTESNGSEPTISELDLPFNVPSRGIPGRREAGGTR